MRTTVTLDDDLLARAKQVAAATGRTLSQVLEDALRDAVTPRPPSTTPYRARLRTFGGGPVRPGVDLSDNAATRDVMDGLA